MRSDDVVPLSIVVALTFGGIIAEKKIEPLSSQTKTGLGTSESVHLPSDKAQSAAMP